MRMFKSLKYFNKQSIHVNTNFLYSIQEIFRDSLHSAELRLRVVKHKNNMDIQTSQSSTVIGNKKQPPPPVFPKPSTNTITPFSNKENITTSNKANKCIYISN